MAQQLQARRSRKPDLMTKKIELSMSNTQLVLELLGLLVGMEGVLDLVKEFVVVDHSEPDECEPFGNL